MTLKIFIWTVSLTLTCMFTSSNGQVQRNLPKDSLSETKEIMKGKPKIVRNHFYQWPDEFLFIQCGLQDKAGNMWFGSAGDGIYFYDGHSFTNFTQNDGLCHNDILCCLEDKEGIIWFGTRNGLIRYKPSGKQPERSDFTSCLITHNTISNATHKKLPYSFISADNFVWSILQDRSGQIWFGTNKGAYHLYNNLNGLSGDTLTFTRFWDNDKIINNDKLLLNEVYKLLEDKNGHIWFLTGWNNNSEGICRYDGKSVTNYKPDDITSFRAMLERKNGDLLFLSPHGALISFDGKTFTEFSSKTGINNEDLFTMKEDRKGNLWFGGENGIQCYDGKLIKLLTTSDGLSHNCVFCIVEDRDGNIWFGTRNTGLCRYDGKTFTDFTE